MAARERGFTLMGLWLLIAAHGLAQINLGTIHGAVRDRSGAALPGALVIATNVDNGAVRKIETGASGEFRFLPLPVGNYDVQVSATGYPGHVQRGIVLNAGGSAAVEFTLRTDGLADEVIFLSEATNPESETPSLSGMIDSRELRDIPLNTRSLLDLVPLQAGAIVAASGEKTVTQGFAEKLAISGTRYQSNSFLLDGAVINDSSGSAGSAAGTLAGVETLREFKVITNAYDAEYGRHAGGVISAITKSGTNFYHGSLFEFFRNDNLDAAKWEDNAFFSGSKPAYRRNQFGGAIGGPAREDRLFLFGSFEGLRERVGETSDFIVPGPEIRAGNFITTKFANGLVARDRTTFLGVDSKVAPFLAAYPVANTACRVNCYDANPFYSADGTGVFARQDSLVTDQKFWTARSDYQRSNRTSLFGRLTIDDARRTDPAFDTAEISESRNYYATMELSRTYTLTLLGRTHFSYSRTEAGLLDERLDTLALADYGLPVLNFTGSDVPGQLFIAGLQGWGGSTTNPKLHIQNRFQLNEDIYWTAGIQALKAGLQFERIQFNQRSDIYNAGQYSFAGIDSFLRAQVAAAQFTRPGADNVRGWRQNVLGLYLHDEINLMQGLTLTFGVRYEIISVPKEANGKIATIRDISRQHLDSVLPSQVDIGDPYFLNPSLKNFGPRVGFSWTPSWSPTSSPTWVPILRGKTTFRGGFGIYHDQLLPAYYITSGVRMEPFYAVAELFSADFTRAGIAVQFPDAYAAQRTLLASAVGKPQAEGIEFNISQPAVLKTSFNIQQELAVDTSLEIGLAASRGLHLARGGILLNTSPVPIRNGQQFIAVDQPLPNASWNRMQWRITDGTSWYNALLVVFAKRFGRGLQGQSSYTFSKSLDDSSTWNDPEDYGDGDVRGVRDAKWKGPSAFDVRHSLTANFILSLPRPSPGKFPGKIFGGWSLSSLLRMSSGYPTTPRAIRPVSGSNSVIYMDGASVDLIAGGDTNPVQPQNPDRYFDQDQFSYPQHGISNVSRSFNSTMRNVPGMGANGAAGNLIAIGNLGRNSLYVPGLATIDLALFKEAPLRRFGESGNIQFRAECYNLINRPNFGSPDTTLFDRRGTPNPAAGTISSTRGNSRQIQLGLRLGF